MFYDIVFPKNNESLFIETAEKLQTEGLCLAYTFTDKKSAEKVKSMVAELQKKTKVKLAAVFNATGIKIRNVHDANEIAVSKAAENSRDVIERYSPDIAYDLELSQQKDFAKARNSGLDKPACQFARENNVIIAFSFSSILNARDQQTLLGRIMQNIRLCKKYKVKTAIASFASEPDEMRSPHDLKSFLLAFGMHTLNAKQSVESVSELFEQK